MNEQKPFFKPCFNQPCCHGNSTRPSQNARINTSVINLDPCKKRAPKHKWFKRYGKLGIGTWKLFGHLKVTASDNRSRFRGCPSGKNRTRASFNKIATNYISVESLINLLYEKNVILEMFSFSMCQEAVRRETTKGSSIEFIGYRIPQHEQNGCSLIHKASINKSVSGFFDILIGYQDIHI